MFSVKNKCEYIAHEIFTIQLTITIYSQLDHLIGPIYPLKELPPSFLLIYLKDQDYAQQAKMRLRY